MSQQNDAKFWKEITFPAQEEETIENTAQLEYHSLLNLFSSVSILMTLHTADFQEDLLSGLINQRIEKFSRIIKEDPDDIEICLRKCPELTQELEQFSKKLNTSQKPEHQEFSSILSEITVILKKVSSELLRRLEAPDLWVVKKSSEIRDELKQFFHAIEKNSAGKYQIVYDIKDQHPTNYVVCMDLDLGESETCEMPPVLIDTLRDLAANARKYTPPGGHIVIQLIASEKTIMLCVNDNGRGIPPDELAQVVQHGYRASNTGGVRSFGGGFGLTKALYVANKYNGTLKIASALNKGTRVTIEIPQKTEI